jgi:hypothetical protein
MLEGYYMEAGQRLYTPCQPEVCLTSKYSEKDHGLLRLISILIYIYCVFRPMLLILDTQRTQSRTSSCLCGIPWTQHAAISIVSNLDSSKYTLRNIDLLPSQAPSNIKSTPQIQGNCVNSKTTPCTLTHTSISEIIYDPLQFTDSNIISSPTVEEIRMRSKSRQAFSMLSSNPSAKFDDTDANPSICRQINEKAYEWALSKLSEKSRKRFLEFGIKFVFEDDVKTWIPVTGLWEVDGLDMEEKTTNNNDYTLNVKSTALRTAVGQNINDGGVHYCKLMSPARVLEWMYTDGLRKNMGFKA